MSSSRVTAFLGLDISNFQSGLDKANGLMARFKALTKVGGFGSLGGLLGVGAMVQSFRAVMERAQQARDAARELGRSVDDGTASVARYADQWDRIKASIADAAISGLAFFTRTGESAGEFVNDQLVSRLRGMTPDQARRTREISESAAANADRLSSPEALAAAKRRGDDKRDASRRTDEQTMREVAGLMNDANARREQTALSVLPIEKQIAELERRRLAFQKAYADGSKTPLTRARAFNDLSKTEEEIARKKAEREKSITEERKKQTDEQKRANKAAADALKDYERALARESAAGRSLATARQDALGFTVADAASGSRGNVAAREAARRIVRDESTARSLADSGRRVTLFDSETQRNREVGADFFQQRALDARQQLTGLISGEKNPFAAAEQELRSAGSELKAAAEALKNAVITVEVDDEES
jgi:hypothetical protein